MHAPGVPGVCPRRIAERVAKRYRSTDPAVQQDDLVAAAMVNVVKAMGRADPTKASYKYYLHVAAENRIRSCLRRNKKRSRQTSLEDVASASGVEDDKWETFLAKCGQAGESPIAAMIASNQTQRLRRYVSRLPQPFRRIVELTFWEGMSTSRIAIVLKTDRMNVSRLRLRAIDMLRTRIARHGSF